MTLWQTKDAIIAHVMDRARTKLKQDDNDPLLRFLDILFSNAGADDLDAKSPEALLALGRYLWQLGETRRPGEPLVEVFNARTDRHGWTTPHTSVAIVNDDMPFLVDSITGALGTALRYRIHELHHPIVRVDRDDSGRRTALLGPVDYGNGTARRPEGQESILYVEIDEESDPAALARIEATIRATLADVRLAVTDWKAMLAKIDETAASLTVNPPPIDDEGVSEAIRFLRWMGSDNYTFLGFREYYFDGEPETATFKTDNDSGLGILRDPSRNIVRGQHGYTAISPEVRDFLSRPDMPLMVTKANRKSTVHRPVHLDYVSLKIYDARQRVVGERRFVGLFTARAYAESVSDTPWLRVKVRTVQEKAGFDPRSHAGKVLAHILETFPRDELFQIEEDLLLSISTQVMHLLERPRPHVFLRRDRFERFVSALIYVPRDNFKSGLRRKAADLLCAAFNGEVSVHYAQLSDDPLGRWHYIIRTKPGQVPEVDEKKLNEELIEAAKTWSERLREQLVQRHGEEEGNQLFHDWSDSFSFSYREDFPPARAIDDIARLARLHADRPVDFAVYHRPGDPADAVRLKIYTRERTVPLSRCMPMLEHAGFNVISEHAYELSGPRAGSIYDFDLSWPHGAVDWAQARTLVEDLLNAVWLDRIADDRFNALVVPTGLDCRQVTVIRAYARYLRQLNVPYGTNALARALIDNPPITRLLFERFEAQLRPDFGARDGAPADAADNADDQAARDARVADIEQRFQAALEAVESLQHDRVLRAFNHAIAATLRTNFWGEYGDAFADGLNTALALKIRTGSIEEAPRPRPWAEIFVYSSRLEGVHLRGGPVARGGLRWSDRGEDFRTEILDLMKAQQVKNAVIVPVGAKGGFVPTRLDRLGRDERQGEGEACYRIFIQTLLSVTDNLDGDTVVPPARVVRRDADDPYLVVAADKGTARFSDTANGIAEARGFWLGDAFASGGSKGYDHKKMGITARGAWVSVQRHFREMGLNVQTDPIDVIGIGDMGGDVFGNGMLLSKTIRLKAAFNHLHIFLDPDPDPETAWAERKRLFDGPASGWADYDPALISTGGGVFRRDAKSIRLTPEIQAFLGVDDTTLTPSQLIHRILLARADLLWIGGIGTYVKAAHQSHSQVGDRANDDLRVDGEQLRVKAVGEGGNLGMTQAGRIEFARAGGRLNTDFIDNSAGVDSSDKEVNIKILLKDAAVNEGLSGPDRDALLVEMTDDVADLVLEDNYLQTLAISVAEHRAVKDRELHAGLIRTLEKEGAFERDLANLPSEEQFSELALNQSGLTRPEIATLMSYAKLSLTAILTPSPMMDEAILQPSLDWGFPAALRERYAALIARHRLRREIVATITANDVINRGGLTFVYEIRQETGLGVEQITAAFTVVRYAFDLDRVWAEIDGLDHQVPAAVQLDMHRSVATFLRHQTPWFLRNAPRPLDMGALIDRYGPAAGELFAAPESVLSADLAQAFEARVAEWTEPGVPDALARLVTAFEFLPFATDIVQVAHSLDRSVADVGRAYFDAGDRLGFDWLRRAANSLGTDDHWDRLAAGAVLDDVADQQRELTQAVLEEHHDAGAEKAVEDWLAERELTLVRTDRLLGDLKGSGQLTVAKLSFAARHLRSILSRALIPS
ncbi:hypothetical protein CCR80_00600 [Rhodothalassium salexigens]|uniref:NAD-glutamate dehydrogenase n=1 Tax=Rhodothalassium salexigens TaxID=1086 RepID=UPI001912026D|nr:NAD-glutamate dehydrogenase [Rhodothalassium salexigens]MBK5919539.1 hypothetical protein [Rhodothalassium salexigens]